MSLLLKGVKLSSKREIAERVLSRMTETQVQEFLDWWDASRKGWINESAPRVTVYADAVVYVDGGCHANGGARARAYGSYKIGARPIRRIDYTQSEARTNNEAEYMTLINALEEMTAYGFRELPIKMDSQLVVEQVNGNWKVKTDTLRDLRDTAREKLKFINATLTWIPREDIVKVLGH